tara:strand:- start:2247 stop:2579 length:333 start_codon:yes stop_codon:yes gene_type:complete
MKKIIIICIIFFVGTAQGISVHTIPLTTICFDSSKEAYLYHTNVMNEKLMAIGKKPNAIISIFHNKDKPTWSLLITARSNKDSEFHTCALFQGYTWIHPTKEESLKKIPL